MCLVEPGCGRAFSASLRINQALSQEQWAAADAVSKVLDVLTWQQELLPW